MEQTVYCHTAHEHGRARIMFLVSQSDSSLLNLIRYPAELSNTTLLELMLKDRCK